MLFRRTPFFPRARARWLASAVPAVASITTKPLKNNSGTVLASTSIAKIIAVKLSDMTIVKSWTSQSTDSSGVLTLSDVLLVNGTDYLLVTSSSDGTAAGVRLYTAA